MVYYFFKVRKVSIRKKFSCSLNLFTIHIWKKKAFWFLAIWLKSLTDLIIIDLMLGITSGQIIVSRIRWAEMSGDIFCKSSHVNNGLQLVGWQTGMGGSNRITRSEVGVIGLGAKLDYMSYKYKIENFSSLAWMSEKHTNNVLVTDSCHQVKDCQNISSFHCCSQN